jgi:hypothetical protein
MRQLIAGLGLFFLGCEAPAPVLHPAPIEVLAPAPSPAPAPAPAPGASEETPIRYVITKTEANVRTSRSSKANLLGQTMPSTRLPVFEEVAEEGTGCSGKWLRVQYKGWVCDSSVYEAPKPGLETEEHFENRFPMQPATIAKDTPVYNLPGGDKIAARGKGGSVEVWRIATFEGVSYAQVGGAAFIPADNLKFLGRGSYRTKLQGAVFDENTKFPFAIYVADETPLLEAPGGRVVGQKLRYDRGSVLSTNEVNGKTFLQVEGGWIEKQKGVVLISPEPRPEGVKDGDHWVSVSLTDQTVVAYQGDRPVFATLTSSGRAGSKGAFWTVTGSFRITRKYRNKTMEGSPFGEPYIVHDVPWPQYVFEGYAFHGAFWHDRFGNIKSHGCMNLSAADSKWLADFIYPQLPAGWTNLTPTLDMDTSIINIRL